MSGRYVVVTYGTIENRVVDSIFPDVLGSEVGRSQPMDKQEAKVIAKNMRAEINEDPKDAGEFLHVRVERVG